MPGRAGRGVSNPRLRALILEEEDPEALAAMMAGTGGALCLGSAGALVGVVAGGTCGTIIGVFPALFTLGLSIPVGTTLGCASGILVGAAAGRVSPAAPPPATRWRSTGWRSDEGRCT